jgi:hypothetical protein
VEARTAAQRYALVAGTVLAVAGIVGFFYSTSFGSPGRVEAMFGVFDVNGWWNAVHLATGALGLLAFASAARTYAALVGVLYVVVAIVGLDFLPANVADDALHLALGGLGLAVAVARR